VAGPWQIPPGMSGDLRVVRIGTGAVGDEDATCPSFAALKARPAIQPEVRPGFLKPKLETFALGPVMTALDGIEFDGMTWTRRWTDLATPNSQRCSGTWYDPELGRPIAAPLERCAELLGVDLATICELAADVEPYLRADGTKVWSA
jgi:hypothetical protein